MIDTEFQPTLVKSFKVLDQLTCILNCEGLMGCYSISYNPFNNLCKYYNKLVDQKKMIESNDGNVLIKPEIDGLVAYKTISSGCQICSIYFC